MKLSLTLFLVLAGCWLNVGSAEAQAVARYALVIGNNTALRAAQTLRYADDDALATHRLLGEAGIDSTLLIAADADTQTLYPDQHYLAPTLDAVQASITRIATEVRARHARGDVSELFFFYSGHGDQNEQSGEGFVLLQGNVLTRSMLYAMLERVGATRNHVIVDACKSNLLVFERGPGGRRTRYTGALLEPSGATQRMSTGFILSTSSGRDSHEWQRYQGGILSHELRSALRGAADIDRNGQISYAEVGAFLTKANAKILSRYRPDFMVRAPESDYERSLLSWDTTTSVELAASSWGHLYVETARGERLVDIHPMPGASAGLWMPAERPLFVRKDDESEEYVIEDNQRLVTPEAPRLPAVARRGALNLALESLFSEPFVPSDLPAFSEQQRARDPLAATHDSSTRRPHEPSAFLTHLALVLGGTGLAAAGVGGYFGVRAIAENSHAAESCPTNTSCSAEGIARDKASRDMATASNVLLFGGAALMAAGVTVYLLRPREHQHEVSLSATPGGGQLSLRGSF